MARLSVIVGRNLWNEEGDVGFEASKSSSPTDGRKEVLKPETGPEKGPLPPLKDTLKTEERVKPGLEGSQSVILEIQLQPITEK